MKTLTALLIACGVLSAQNAPTPIWRVNVTERSAKAISYQHRNGATKIDFQGTALMPAAHGEAKVESKQGYIEVEVEFRNLPDATKFGAEYLTYVLWAVTPEGRTSNLGEVLRNGTSSKLDITTELQVFSLFVTAEPYFAVSKPSDVVVMENIVRADTLGKVEQVDAKFELLQRGQYQHLANVLNLKIDPKTPIEVYEARNAVQIARASGADRYAKDTFEKAESNLKQAEAYMARKAGNKPVAMTARQAVQVAEDARAIAVTRQDEELAANERQAGADREAKAEAGRNAAKMETERVTAAAAKAKMDAQNEADRLKRNSDASAAAAKNAADNLKMANDAKTASAQNEADRLKRENDAQKASAQAELDRVNSEKNRLETEKVALRAQLLLQFNTILQTRDTARGLIVNMSDVLFDSGKFSLRPEAREKLAKVAGVVAGHPGLHLEVEGHTDNVGSDAYNQKLSEDRGSSVRTYLTQDGIQQASVTTQGFGKNQPIANNDTAAGRQQNRRVELVISGEIIGSAIGTNGMAR